MCTLQHSCALTFVMLLCRLVTPTHGYPSVTDGWKLELLDTLCLDHYFTAEQARRVLESIDYADSRVVAAARIFTRVTDTENWPRATDVLTGVQQHELHALLGFMYYFAPRNPTGHYKLALASQAQFMCATRLLEIYRTQWANGLCRWPRSCCFVECIADGVQLDTREPHKLSIPHGCSNLEIAFVDLAPIPSDVEPMHPSTFSVLRLLLINSPVRTLAQLACRLAPLQLRVRGTTTQADQRLPTTAEMTRRCWTLSEPGALCRTTGQSKPSRCCTILKPLHRRADSAAARRS